MYNNQEFAQGWISFLKSMGTKTICVCPGARNSPLVDLLSAEKNLNILYFFDERAASFFALGRIRSESSPVAVITTSGTAVAELFPAAMEAYYSCQPLILITADRPKNYRGTGAPQSAEQNRIFGLYTPSAYDFDCSENEYTVSWNQQAPLHLNLCFDEPLLGKKSEKIPNIKYVRAEATTNAPMLDIVEAQKALENFLKDKKRPLAIISGLKKQEANLVEKFLLHSNTLVYAEGPSQLRESKVLEPQKIWNLEGDFEFDGVIRIGDVPTHRYWRDLEIKKPCPVFSINSKPFSGLTHGKHVTVDLEKFFQNFQGPVFQRDYYTNYKIRDDEKYKEFAKLLKSEPHSEPALFFQLSLKAPQESMIYLGNSLPVRQWDLAATLENKSFEILATRGVNGIDGQISTFFGLQKMGQEAWAIIGDLTALYDLQGPWIIEQLKNFGFKIIIINNSGGQIFNRMFGKKEFLNEHSLSFDSMASMWGLSYEKVYDLNQSDLKSSIIEICPDSSSTQRFWEEYKKI